MEFYVFDVDHGQCAALQLPNGRWCVFDVGQKPTFSPMDWIVERMRNQQRMRAALMSLLTRSPTVPQLPPPRILKATISHLHGDHLAEWQKLLDAGPEYFRTVDYDESYIRDVAASSTQASAQSIAGFCLEHLRIFGPASTVPDYGGASIDELTLLLSEVYAIGGDANARVNNASVVTRISWRDRAILLCGDMHAEAWDYALGHSILSSLWVGLVSNVDVLVAPHHGHASGFSTRLLELARPQIVLTSITAHDEHIDSRYSSDLHVRGVTMSGGVRKCLTTRQSGHVRVSIDDSGSLSVILGEAALGS